MDWSAGILLGMVGWVVWSFAARRIMDNPRNDAGYGIGLAVVSLYARLVHRLQVLGTENLPADPGPLVVIVNHTSGVDPVLVQAACPFEIRWLMARDMMVRRLDPFWNWLGVIPVERTGMGVAGSDASAAREAIRHLHNHGVIGVFPEGGIERPARTLRPFAAGIGLLVKRGKARVLPIVIEGTPDSDSAWGSLLRTSRSTLRILPPIDIPRQGTSPEQITHDLLNLYANVTGWPVIDPAQRRHSSGT